MFQKRTQQQVKGANKEQCEEIAKKFNKKAKGNEECDKNSQEVNAITASGSSSPYRLEFLGYFKSVLINKLCKIIYF